MYNIDKLIDFTERSAGEIAREWCRNIQKNPRTPSYHKLAEKDMVQQAVHFYNTLRPVMAKGSTYADMEEFAVRYAEDRIAEGIPMHEAIYALIMMRRHIWLFAEFQLLFTTALDMYQAVESINKIVLLTDYAIYAIAKKYGAALPGTREKTAR
jgi:hypothetical protein